MELLNQIEALINDGYVDRFQEVVDRLTNKPKLPEGLQKKLDETGNTPISEPKLYEALQKSNKDLALAILTREDITKTYSAVEVGNFLHLLKEQLTSLKDSDGNFKVTENTKECNLPDYFESEELLQLSNDDRKLRTELATMSRNNKDVETLVKKVNKATDKATKKALAISGLDVDLLSEWEINLVVANVFSVAVSAGLSAMGKQL